MRRIHSLLESLARLVKLSSLTKSAGKVPDAQQPITKEKLFIIESALLVSLFLIWGSGAFASSYIQVVEQNTSPSESTEIYLPLVSKGQPAAVLKWLLGGCFSSWCQTGWYSSPAVANIDNDPQLEILAGTYDLTALDGETGALQWRASSSSRVWPGVAIADLTGDGTLEIIVGRNGDQLSVYASSGGLLWSRNPFGSGEIRSLAVADLENDGQLETIVGRASGGATKQISIYEPDGSIRAGWPARHDGEVGYGWGMYNENIAAGDINGDGYQEIVGPTDTHYITALDRSGNQLPTHAMFNNFNPQGAKVWSQVGVHVDNYVDLRGYAECGTEHRPNFADSAPYLTDLDGDGRREIIVIGNVYNCGTDPYTSLYQMPFIFNADRSRWSGAGFDWTIIPLPDSSAAPLSEDYNRIETAVPNPVVVDLDGDKFKEILYPSYDGRLHVFWLDKTEHGSWPYEVYHAAEGTMRFASEPAVADLDNDGKAEVIFASWVEKGSDKTGKLHILDYLGNVLFEIALPAAVGEDWNGSLAAPTLANVDLDPDLEVVLLTANSGVVVYDLPGTNAAHILWGTGRADFQRSGSR